MRIFKNRHFHRWAKDVNLGDDDLKKAGQLFEVK